MPRSVLVGVAVAAMLALVACAETPTATRADLPAATHPTEAAQKAQAVRAWVPEVGYVRGTPEAIASLGKPLQAVPGPNRTVETCRSVVESEAQKLGARNVEAVSAGPHRRNAKGQYVASVWMRITYVRPDGYEVRQATMTCIVDHRNRIVDASAS